MRPEADNSWKKRKDIRLRAEPESTRAFRFTSPTRTSTRGQTEQPALTPNAAKEAMVSLLVDTLQDLTLLPLFFTLADITLPDIFSPATILLLTILGFLAEVTELTRSPVPGPGRLTSQEEPKLPRARGQSRLKDGLNPPKTWVLCRKPNDNGPPG
ncbi:hypothetical protein J6590_088711 [Homalodisca vitripennis]|nr:hypothetical protein J6590_088711 [Homalodisca vitripennis]